MASNRWKFAVDRGGTFTDIVAVDPSGTLRRLKTLSRSPRYDDAAITGIRRLLDLADDAPLPADRIAEIRMGTTVATNALLERQGEPTALVITEGFADLLDIGTQARPRLFDLAIRKPKLLYTAVIEATERIDADGAITTPLDETTIRARLADLRATGINALAVVSLHAWINPAHELAIGAIAHDLGFTQVSLSHQCVERIGAVGRGRTALVDAYLSPILARYVAQVRRHTGDIPLHFMQSSGGLAAATRFTGKDAILSGPAGGVVATARRATEAPLGPVIGFDMGGTSTDVCRYADMFERSFETTTAGVAFMGSMLTVETVAAGGGSILAFDGRRMTVGPASAGADPGPACYGRGGPLTVTDANLLLGRLDPASFPQVFGPNENEPLDAAATETLFAQRTDTINAATGSTLTPAEVALGYLRIADEIMARPIRTLSIARGYDVRNHTLVAFGGAGGLHACSLARTLGMKRVYLHPLAGLFSAYGIGMADQTADVEATCLLPMTDVGYAEALSIGERIAAPLAEQLVGDRVGGSATVTRSFDLRPVGADGFLTIDDVGYEATLRAYKAAFMARFGFAPDSPIEIVNVRVHAMIDAGRSFATPTARGTGHAKPGATLSVRFSEGEWETPVIAWGNIDTELTGPALVVDDHTTLLLPPGFVAALQPDGALLLIDEGAPTTNLATADPILLEVFNHAFMSVADQMGQTLVNTAHSVNMKERLDFSCALFDPDGELVANAPHVPVHLGAMGESVKGLIAAQDGAFVDGRVFVTNHPAKGGSHLPDVTVITPVFLSPDRTAPDFFVATRGHHADIGGKNPGSLSPFSTTLAAEGVVLDNLLIVDGGRFLRDEVVAALTVGPWPARNIPERLSDLTAQIAANRRGVGELARLVDEHGEERVKEYMRRIRENAAHAVRLALTRLLMDGPSPTGAHLVNHPSFVGRFEDAMDDGSPIVATVTVTAGGDPPDTATMQVDFTGSAPAHPMSLNAPFAVVRAAVIYVVRSLVDDDIPLNDGCMAPVTLVIPPDSILSPPPGAAVVGGNVETSQRIVDALLGALGLASASQGTMNNVTVSFDDASFYETIAGGSGATPEADGASGVQVHMTNTRITDPEVLERRFPGVRLTRFSLRRDTGGDGRHRGGDGVVREFLFVRHGEATLFTERRTKAPFGLAGGSAGALGRNTIIGADGAETTAPGHATVTLTPGQRLRIETPGGGGYGTATHSPV